MKTTEDYLMEMLTELGKMPKTLSEFQVMRMVTDLCAKYAVLIDAVKIIKE